MKFSLKSELPTLIVVFLPFVYLLLIWNTLPETVPTHWNINGEIDQTGNKQTLLWLPFLLPVLTYFLLTVAPMIDPKRKLQSMGGKLANLKFAVTFIMSALALFIIYSAKQQELSPNLTTMLLGVMFVVFGNFFPALKPNYFIGIRVPWTMNSENNWKQTHRFAGKLWMIGGCAILVQSLFSNLPAINNLFAIGVTAIISVVPIVFSYTMYHKEKKAA